MPKPEHKSTHSPGDEIKKDGDARQSVKDKMRLVTPDDRSELEEILKQPAHKLKKELGELSGVDAKDERDKLRRLLITKTLEHLRKKKPRLLAQKARIRSMLLQNLKHMSQKLKEKTKPLLKY